MRQLRSVTDSVTTGAAVGDEASRCIEQDGDAARAEAPSDGDLAAAAEAWRERLGRAGERVASLQRRAFGQRSPSIGGG